MASREIRVGHWSKLEESDSITARLAIVERLIKWDLDENDKSRLIIEFAFVPRNKKFQQAPNPASLEIE
jgi:hypothetical protein